MKRYENDGEKYLLPIEVCTVSFAKTLLLFLIGIICILPLVLLLKNWNSLNDVIDIIGFSVLALFGVFLIILSIISGRTYLTIDTEKIQIKNRRINKVHYWSDMNNLNLDIKDSYSVKPMFVVFGFRLYISTSYILDYYDGNGTPHQFAFDLHRKKFNKRMMQNTIWCLYNRYHQNIG